jgi:hypothetical protein
MRRLFFGLPLVAAMLWLSPAALAGGWAITTLDSLPQDVRAGQTYRIGYVIRQHGVTPMVGATPAIRISQGATQLTFAGREEGQRGHYVSDVTFPADGEWAWTADQSPFPMPQPLGTLVVGSALSAEPQPRAPAALEIALPGLALLALLGLLAVRQVKRVATSSATPPGVRYAPRS